MICIRIKKGAKLFVDFFFKNAKIKQNRNAIIPQAMKF